MSETLLSLHFDWSTSPNTDFRTFSIYKPAPDADSERTELYRFYHPGGDFAGGLTTFQRQNMETRMFEPAGQIDWLSNYNATIHFGVDQVPIRELRKAKKSNSQSRRFKAGTSEYKWKRVEGHDLDLQCVDTKGKLIAAWNQEDLSLSILSSKGEQYLDRVVVTCFLNMWILSLGQW